MGRRINKTFPAGETSYVYDGDNIEEELNGATGTLGERYTYGPGIDELLAMYRAGAAYYYQADGLGSIVAVTNAAGSPVAAYAYDSFGNRVFAASNVSNSFGYTGRELDSETGLFYYRARYYDPSVGRFISEDPIKFIGGTNFYRYVGNSPLDFVDPFGLCPPDVERCKTAVLNAVNQQFGTNLTQGDIQSASLESGGEVNVNFRTTALTPAQFNAIQPGRFAPGSVLGFLTGYGPSLHVVSGPSALDPNALNFVNQNIGGALSASFTAHLDSAWAYNPIGAILHGVIDVHGHNTRDPCP